MVDRMQIGNEKKQNQDSNKSAVGFQFQEQKLPHEIERGESEPLSPSG